MKIDKEFVNKIFNLKIKLKNNNDKIKLSQFTELIPMYDIYTNLIYLIKDDNLHHRLINNHYRFISDEVINWMKNQIKDNKDNTILINKFKRNIEIMENYNIEELLETSFKTLYKFSPDLGLKVSICKRKSFHKLANHLNPYYSLEELIKLGKNNKIIKKEIRKKELLNPKLHYDICKLISNNDISIENIIDDTKLIIENNLISDICYFSYIGSYLFNNYLRNNELIDKYSRDIINKINKIIIKSNKLDKDYFLYRFIENDDFISNLKLGQVFTDKGYLSTTRDPFYSPGLSSQFGLILMKINIPRKFTNLGLFIELFSLFPKEQEFMMIPKLKLKLKSKDDKFKYYHINKDFENNISKKYEFDVIGFANSKNMNCCHVDSNEIILNELEYEAEDKFTMINSFIQNANEMDIINLVVNDKLYNFHYQFFDSTDVYGKLFHNKMKDGIVINYYKNNYPVINLELGEELSLNYLKKKFYHNKFIKDEDDILISCLIGSKFNYNKLIVYSDYTNFSEFTNDPFAYTKHYNKSLYDYFKKGKEFIDFSYTKYDINLSSLSKSKIKDELKEKLPEELRELTFGEVFIKIVEEYFSFYEKYEEYLNQFYNNFIKNNFIEIDIKYYLRNKLNINYNPINIQFNKENIKNEKFKQIFRNTLRRE